MQNAKNEAALEALSATDATPPAALDVRALRERMKLTQREFAGWFGFPVPTLRHWERGNGFGDRPPPLWLVRLRRRS